jgi:hypothetical protein
MRLGCEALKVSTPQPIIGRQMYLKLALPCVLLLCLFAAVVGSTIILVVEVVGLFVSLLSLQRQHQLRSPSIHLPRPLADTQLQLQINVI